MNLYYIQPMLTAAPAKTRFILHVNPKCSSGGTFGSCRLLFGIGKSGHTLAWRFARKTLGSSRSQRANGTIRTYRLKSTLVDLIGTAVSRLLDKHRLNVVQVHYRHGLSVRSRLQICRVSEKRRSLLNLPALRTISGSRMTECRISRHWYKRGMALGSS
jgi:hypothetical protein